MTDEMSVDEMLRQIQARQRQVQARAIKVTPDADSEFAKPSGPDLAPIMAMHRSHDGWIAFATKNSHDAQYQTLWSVRAKDLEGYFPQLIPALDADAYFSINGFYRAGFGRARRSPHGLDLPRAERSTGSLRWLTACFADLDCYKLKLTAGQVIGSIIDAQDRDEIPPASMLVRSGQGVWAFWFLVEHDKPNEPVRAWPENITLWCAIQHRLTERFAALGADAGARDPARVTRIPGSINGKSGARVAYWIQADAGGNRFVYGLHELAVLLGVQTRKRTKSLEGKLPGLTKGGDNGGWIKRWLNARENFERLWELRGAFKEGTRNNAVFVYASILRSLYLPEETVLAEVDRLYASLDQPSGSRYTNSELLETLRSAVGKRRVFNQTFADRLDITPAEAAVLNGWPAASKYGGHAAVQTSLSQDERTRRRREALKTKLDGRDSIPNLKDLAEWLTRIGHECTFRTVADDLKALDIRTGREHRRRIKRTPQPRPLLPPE